MTNSPFEIDKQSLNDLSIFPNMAGDRSVLALFDHTTTIGGKNKLIELFNCPLRNAEDVENRIDAINFLSKEDINFSFNRGACDFIEFYLTQHPKPTLVSKIKAIEQKVMYFFTGDNNVYIINLGIENTLHILEILDDFSNAANFQTLPKLLQDYHSTIVGTIAHPDFIFVRALFKKKKRTAIDIARADYLFRYLG